MQELESLQKNYQDNCKTQSVRSSILEVYSYILKYEYVDSDYWTTPSGFEFINSLLNNFNEDDWLDLAVDSPSWTHDQIWILAGGLFYVEGHKTNHSEDKITNIENRFFAMIPALLKTEAANFIPNFMITYSHKINFKDKKVLEAIAKVDFKESLFNQNWFNEQNPSAETL